ncbi:PIN domain-containing protein [Rhizobium sp. WSM1325]|uniref:PIN domain-containing protein n=1 Tax=Rhizobium sp. WSM1325 TaxID=3444086 RepID=UPI000FF385A6|nr:hypothetical protein [Rhizobium leguminosarum]RWY70024.1 hypothetical protein EHI48_27025 [Rhizobium leguminosarum]
MGTDAKTVRFSRGTKKEPIGKIIEILHAYVEVLRHHPTQASMAYTAGTELNRPDSYAVFETLCMELGAKMINATEMEKNGRRGQPQKGVDVWGWRNNNVEHIVGVQCKQKGFGQDLEEKEVRDEWEQALTFVPPIKEFYLLTTANNDAAMEQLARELCLDLLQKTGRSVPYKIWGWGRICDALLPYPDLIKIFQPDYGLRSQEHSDKLDNVIEMMTDERSTNAFYLKKIWAAVNKSNGVMLLDGVDDASAGNEIDKVYDQQIDGYRSIQQGGRPTTALPLFEKMLKDVGSVASDRILFRIKANIAACFIALDDIERGCKLLLEACDCAPDEPKAISNRALAHLLLRDFPKVLETGREQFEADVADEALWGHVIQAAAQNGVREQPLSLVPERHQTTEGVVVAEVQFYRIHGNKIWREKAARARSLFPESRYARQFFADSFLDQAGKAADSWKTGTLPFALRGHIEASAETYRDIWQEVVRGDAAVGKDDFVVLANWLVALRLLDSYPEALAVIEKERQYVERDQDVLARAAIAAYEAGSELADELAPLLENSAIASMLKLQLALRKADWKLIAELPDSNVDTVDPPERAVYRTAINMCRVWKGAGGIPSAGDLEAPVAGAANDPRASILAADMCMAFGAPTIAETAYDNAREALTETSHWTSRISVAKHAFRRQKWRDAAEHYLGAVDETRDSDELRDLAVALAFEVPQTGQGARFYQDLNQNLRKDQFYRHFEAVMLFNAGDMPKAEAAARSLLKDVQRLDTFNLLAMTLQRRGRLDRIKEFLRKNDVLTFEGGTRDKLSAAQVLHEIGRIPEALTEVYRLYMAHRDRPDVALTLFGMVINERSYKHIPHPSVVTVDAWVRLEDHAGHPFTFIVGEDVSIPNGVYPATHPVVSQAMGKSIGESFTVSRDVGGQIAWTVKEVRHRWSQAARDIGHNFETQFPDENGVYSYTMKDNDIQPMLDLVKQQAEANKQFAKQYADGLPLAFLSGRMKKESISFAEYIRSLGMEIRTCFGSSQERAEAFAVIEQRRASGAVLDTYTAWVAAALDVLPILKELFGSLYVPQAVHDDLLLLRGFEKPGKSFSIVFHDGEFLKHETSREEELNRRKVIEGREKKIREYCEVLPVSAPEITGDFANDRKQSVEIAVENFGSGVLDPAALAANGYVLLSEDMNYRTLARGIWPIQGVWLQPALESAARLGLMTYDECVAKIVALARLRHGHVSIEDVLLLKALKSGDETAVADFKALAAYIGTASADIYAHMGVVVRFTDAVLEVKELPHHVRLKAISILLENLIRSRPDIYARVLVAVLIACDEEGQSAVAHWIKGHFMLPDAEEAHRVFSRRTLSNSIWKIIRSNSSLVGNISRLSSPRPIQLPKAFNVKRKKI